MPDDTPKPKPRKKRASKRVRQQRGSAGCMGIIAFVFLTVAGVLAFNTWSFNQRATTVDAIVIDIEVVSDDEGTTYRPVFGFPGPEGPVEASPKVAASGYDYDIGDTVEVRYDPEDPTHAIPTGALTPWMFALVAGTFGTLILIVAGLTLASSIKADRRRDAK